MLDKKITRSAVSAIPLRVPISICSFLFCVLLSFHTKGQCGVDTNILRQRLNDNMGYRCGLGKAFAISKQVPLPPEIPVAIPPPTSSFPASAIVSCGHFTFYYDDIRLGLLEGYNAPGALGPLRRNNLCQVVAYLESVFDFSKVPPGGLRIHVERSDWHSYLSPGTGGSAGMPFYDLVPGFPTIKGRVADYTQSGVDPVGATGFHGQLGIDFSMPNINSDASVTASCDIDLFTVELHEMCHILGFFSFIDPLSTTSFSTIVPAFSKVDRNLFTTPHPYTSTTAPFTLLAPLVTGSPAFSTTPGAKVLWLNNLQPPKNESVEFTMSLSIGPSCPVYKSDFIDNGLHINDNNTTYGFAQRLSPGDQESYVLGPRFYEGEYRRVLMKGEIEEFINILNYKYNPTYAAANAVKIANTKPHSIKMGSVAYSMTYADGTTPETIVADYTLTNNTGASLSIDLNTLADLVDADGDPKSVYPGSLVNFRGCGNGDNNHNRLALSGSDRIITYTPGPNFYGRAQFGFNLYDSKERGGFVIFTINVLRGTNVTLPAGGDMVLNGSFEAGSEVKTFGSAASENVNNALGYNGSKVCRISSLGAHMADSHPWDFMTNSHSGHSIYQSAGSCAPSSTFPTFLKTPFGGARGNFYPYNDPSLVDYPLSSPGGGHRYQPMNGDGVMFYLAHCLKTCKRYRLSFYGKRTATGFVYPAKESIEFGFLNDAHLGSTLAVGGPLLPLPFSPTAGGGAIKKAFTMATWDRTEISFSYCGTDSLNILYLNAFSHLLSPPSFIIDSVRLVEIPDVITAVAIEVSNSAESACQKILEAVPVTDDDGTYGCGTGAYGFTYSWTKSGSPTVIGTARTLLAEPLEPTTYTVTIDDGCGHTATESVTLEPCRCSPYVLFGNTTAFTALSGPVSSSLGAGLYYVADDITIPASISFTDAVMLMAPRVQITVANTAKLTIDHAHLFTCPDSNQLWKGIDLASSGSSSGRIEVRNNSLIEDAEIAIKAVSPSMPVSGDIISSRNSVYNRNLVGIYIDDFKSTATLSYPFTIAGNVFTARLFNGVSGYPNSWPGASALLTRGAVVNAQANDAVHQDYAKALCKNSIFSNAGISLNEVGTNVGSSYYEILIGEASSAETNSLNLFDNQGFGIRMNNTNMTSYNNRFINMSMLMEPVARGTTTPYLYDASAGIFAYTTHSGITDRLRVLPNALQKGNSFHDCFTGILTINQAELEVNGSDITSSHTLGDDVVPGAAYTDQFYEGEGIKFLGHRNQRSVKLTYNNISNMNEGIYVYLNNPEAGAVTAIDHNWFYNSNRSPVYHPLFSHWQYMLQAVEVFANFEDRNSTLSITGNTFDSVYNAIQANKTWITKATISGNTINLWDKTMSTIGTPQYGIQVLGTNLANVNSNIITTPTLGIASQADNIKGVYATFNYMATICNNNVSNIGRSFEFDQLRPQWGTVWAGNTMQNAWKGFVLGAPIDDQLVIGGVNTPAGNKWLGTTWSSAKPSTFATVDSRSSKLSVQTGAGLFEYPTDNLGAPLLRYTPAGPIASILTPTTSVYTCSPPTSPFIVSSSLLEDILTDSLSLDIPTENLWMAQFDLYKTALMDTILQDSITKLNTFMTAAINSRYQWLAAIEAALADGNTTAAQNLITTPVQAMGRVQVGNSTVVVNDVNAANYVVDNYLRYYGIYLRFLDSTLTGSDTTSLQELALKCPAIDGAVVYQARGLLRLFTGIVGEYQDQDCRTSGLYRTTPQAETEGGQQAYNLFPNPNQGSFTIRQLAPNDRAVRIKVYNALGMEVYQSYSTFKGGKLMVSIGQQAPGLYLVCIDDEKGKNTCLRFIIK